MRQAGRHGVMSVQTLSLPNPKINYMKTQDEASNWPTSPKEPTVILSPKYLM